MGNDIFDVEEQYLDVIGTLGSRIFSVHLQQNCTLVFLVHNVILESIPLGLQGLFGPKFLWGFIICTNDIVFSGTLTLYLLLS